MAAGISEVVAVPQIVLRAGTVLIMLALDQTIAVMEHVAVQRHAHLALQTAGLVHQRSHPRNQMEAIAHLALNVKEDIASIIIVALLILIVATMNARGQKDVQIVPLIAGVANQMDYIVIIPHSAILAIARITDVA